MPRLRLLALLLALAPPGCAVYPARFADAPAILEVADDAPIPLPRRTVPLDVVYVTDVYIRRPIVSTLEPDRTPDAGDVNAVDDVPRSSWFDPDARSGTDGPPVPPLKALAKPPDSGLKGIAVVDARGIRYELRGDPPDRPELTTAAAAVASRLLRAIGYRTPDVWVIDRNPGDLLDAPKETKATGRIAAVRWPIGIDVGATPPSEMRGDDPNDRVPHPDRRTLRALKTALYWIGMRRLWPDALRDTYVGLPDRGHLLHYIVGLEAAFGADAVTHPDSELDGESALQSFLTLGLLVRRPTVAQTRWPAIGNFFPESEPAAFRTGPPYEPLDRALPGDIYWMAKRIAAVPKASIDGAIQAARMHDEGSRVQLAEVLEVRRKKLIEDGYGRVSPCEVARVEPGRITLRDEAIALGIATAAASRYVVSVLDSEGASVVPPSRRAGEGPLVAVPVPEGGGEYLVLRVLVERGKKAAPRAMEVHLVRRGSALRVVGVRH